MITRQTVGQYYPVRPLGDLVDFLDSQRRPITESDRKPGPFPYYGANGIQGHIDSYLFDEPLVLLAEDGGHFDEPSRGIAYRISGKSWVNNHAHVIRPKAVLDIGFLCRVLENYDVRPFISGTTRSKLTKGQAEKIGIPVPPIPEQRRIAAILDQADELRQKRQCGISQLAQLPQAVFTEMFYGAERFPLAQIDEVCSLVTDGTHYTPTYADTGVIFLSAKNVTSGYINWNDIKYIPETLHADLQRRVSPQVGDVLLAKNGTTGVSAIVDRDVVFDIYVSLALLRPGNGMLSAYLHQAVSSLQCRQQFTGALKGIGVSNLHLVDIRRTRIPKPPLALQERFVRQIASMERLRVIQTQHLIKLNTLFASLQQRAFSGELTARLAERELELAG